VCLAYWPYLVFHVTFHETETTRYALPLVVPMAGLAVIGLSVFGRRVATAGSVVAAVACLWVGQPLLQSYGSKASPTAAVMQDMINVRASSGLSPVVQMQHQVWWPTRRIVRWVSWRRVG
jgi:hypothetical protein